MVAGDGALPGSAGREPRLLGFVPASRPGLRCQGDEVQDEALMARFLAPEPAGKGTGAARCRKDFDAAL